MYKDQNTKNYRFLTFYSEVEKSMTETFPDYKRSWIYYIKCFETLNEQFFHVFGLLIDSNLSDANRITSTTAHEVHEIANK